jgi:hypothetical protein
MVFILATFKEIMEETKNPFAGGKEKGPRAVMMEYVGRLFSDERIDPSEKKELKDIIKKKVDEIEVEEKKTSGL